ncbi:hypothetical protein MACH09_00810 [Vibrio sp. MACH09]|nr:hypothetical protein MACH09_00810 [Vibrio sp. MACH09]
MYQYVEKVSNLDHRRIGTYLHILIDTHNKRVGTYSLRYSTAYSMVEVALNSGHIGSLVWGLINRIAGILDSFENSVSSGYTK